MNEPQPVRLSILGSCRVFRPLEATERCDLVTLRSRGIRSFCHTVPEVLQKFAYAQHELTFPESLSLLINGTEKDGNQPPPPLGYFDETDAYVVEISSRKHLTIDGYAIQMPYFVKHFVHAHQLEIWWREMKKMARQTGRASLRCDLPGVNPAIREIASSVVLRTDTMREIEEGIGVIKERLGKPVIFVGHFDLIQPDGQPLVPERREINDLLRRCCQRLNAPYLEPAGIILRYGMLRSLRPKSTDHWAKEILLQVGKLFLNQIIHPALGRPPLSDEQKKRKLPPREASEDDEE